MKSPKSKEIPQHVAVIMDGNGRWAKQRHLPRTQGHMEGVKRVEEIIETAHDLGIKVLTLFTFSTENWNRPKDEVSVLMNILVSVLNRKLAKLKKANIRLSMIGKREGIPNKVLDALDQAMKETRSNTGLIMNLAFNYGSRIEIIDAIKEIAQAVQRGNLDIRNITEDTVGEALYTKDLPDPDLLIRTSGEQRISNFLLWQLSYAEFYFTEKFWPDFRKEDFLEAIEEYQHRERRYGKTEVKTQ